MVSVKFPLDISRDVRGWSSWLHYVNKAMIINTETFNL